MDSLLDCLPESDVRELGLLAREVMRPTEPIGQREWAYATLHAAVQRRFPGLDYEQTRSVLAHAATTRDIFRAPDRAVRAILAGHEYDAHAVGVGVGGASPEPRAAAPTIDWGAGLVVEQVGDTMVIGLQPACGRYGDVGCGGATADRSTARARSPTLARSPLDRFRTAHPPGEYYLATARSAERVVGGGGAAEPHGDDTSFDTTTNECGGGGNFARDNRLENEELAWYTAQPAAERERLGAAHAAVMARSTKPLRFRVLDSQLPAAVKADIIRRHEISLRSLGSSGLVATPDPKFQTYVDAALQLPLGCYEPLPVDPTDPQAVCWFAGTARRKMDAAIYGQAHAKAALVETLVAWVANPEYSAGTVLGLCGAPGVGKTSLVKHGLAGAVDWPFAYVSLAGTAQAAHLGGFSQTYEGSRCGLIAQELIKARRLNLILMLDEVDKCSERRDHNEVMDFLCSLVDGSNRTFMDEYFNQIPLDLSKAMIVFGYNDPERLSGPLRDRIHEIKMESFDLTQQVEIAERHLVPELLKELGLAADAVGFAPGALAHLARRYTSAQTGGVRDLRKALQRLLLRVNVLLTTRAVEPLDLVRDAAARRVLESNGPLLVTHELIDELLECLSSKTDSAHQGMFI